MSCTAWVESSTLAADYLVKTHRFCQQRESVTAWPYHCSPYVRRFVYNKRKVKFMHSCNHIFRPLRKIIVILHTKRDCRLFNWSTWFTGHKQRTVGFPQRKTLSRSTANSTVTVCSELFVCNKAQTQTHLEKSNVTRVLNSGIP